MGKGAQQEEKFHNLEVVRDRKSSVAIYFLLFIIEY